MYSPMAYFSELCPNCGSRISDVRLFKGLPCSHCLEETQTGSVCEVLKASGKMQGMATFCQLQEETKKFEHFFKRNLGFGPWSLQLSWFKRAFLKKSFAIVAPTGVGKTTFGMLYAAYIQAPSYIILPTKMLVEQVCEKLSKMVPCKEIVAYLGKKGQKELIQSAGYRILITTVNFFYRNAEILPKNFFKFVFVDDIDAILKSSRRVELLFQLLGFDEANIASASKIRLSQEELKRIKAIREKMDVVLVVSSATVQPKPRRMLLFERLLGFEISRTQIKLRNIVDALEEVKDEKEALKKAVAFIKEWGGGTFVFVSSERGKEGVEKVVSFLNKCKIRAISYENFKGKNKEAFRQGKIQAVVGIGTAYNSLARGIDLPEAVRYIVFIDVPKMVFPASVGLNPRRLFGILLALKDLLPVDKNSLYLSYLKKYLGLSEAQLARVMERYPKTRERLQEIADFLDGLLKDKSFRKRIEGSDTVGFQQKNGRWFIVVADVNGYLQASGRASRLFAGGLSKGLVVTFYWDKKALNSLLKRLKNSAPLGGEIKFWPLKEVNLKGLFEEIDKDREKIKSLITAVGSKQTFSQPKDLFTPTLVIVESPTKAKTIAGLFGKPAKRKIGNLTVYEVNLENRLLCITASLGHVCDLITNEGYFGIIEEDGRFLPIYAPIKRCGHCGVQTADALCPWCHNPPSQTKKEVILGLRQMAIEVDEIFIGTDPDTEGEKIGWDLFLLLRCFNHHISRIEFHEVTRQGLLRAIKRPREFSLPLVKAQILRRVADRWVGFVLSRQLWEAFGKNTLSAGRVQTPVLGWVIKREQDRRQKKAVITFLLNEHPLSFEELDLNKARKIFAGLDNAQIEIVSWCQKDISPSPPYDTSSILIDSSHILHLSAQNTMQILQELFEKGLITYHRTDSTHVSEFGQSIALEYITQKFGRDFWAKRSWGKAGTHECIRPTRPLDDEELRFLVATGEIYLNQPKQAIRLYRLIFNRFMASQMREAQVKVTEIRMRFPDLSGTFLSEHTWQIYSEIIKPGFDLVTPLKVIPLTTPLKIEKRELKFVPQTPPFTEGSLIEEMKKKGLGRPSTYAKIVSVLLERRYLISRKEFLFPTRLGRDVFNFLEANYHEYIDEEFTRLLEQKMDAVEKGQEDYQVMLHSIFKWVIEGDTLNKDAMRKVLNV